MKVVIIKYNSGNVQSVAFALERIGISPIISNDAEVIQSADKVIFPGVGEASTAMNYLKEKKLDKVIVDLKQPVLGICLGMQLMCDYSEEGNTACLGIFNQKVRKFKNEEQTALKIPQVGWNTVYNLQTNLYNGINENVYMYFVHGYYIPLGENTIATADYIIPYSVALNQNNFYGVQFHPEKSSEAGETMLENFIKL
jgi:glutamine amidotransferase